MDEWFGVVRWCNEDIEGKLIDMGFPATEENIMKVRKFCENNKFFRDTMIEAGWYMIEDAIWETVGK